MKISILAALPHEMDKIRSAFKAKKIAGKAPFDVYRADHLSHEVSLMLTGIGTANAGAAARYVRDRIAPDFLLSVGYGGALFDEAEIGDLVWGSRFFSMNIDHQSLAEGREIAGNEELFGRLGNMISIRKGSIVTLPALMKKSAIIAVMPSGVPFPVCDMETFSLAGFCSEAGIRFAAVRSITDLQDEDIPPELGEISDSSGRYSAFRALRRITAKPGLIPAVYRLARNSNLASQKLCRFAESFIEIL